MTQTSAASPFPPDFLANPYPVYRQMRAASPVFWQEQLKVWLLTRYSDVMQALRDPRLSTQRNDIIRQIVSPEDLPKLKPFMTSIDHWMLTKDPPEHTRLRSRVMNAFTPGMLKHLTGHIEQIAEELVAAAADRGHMDVLNDLASPLSVTIVAEMLGVRAEDRERFKEFSNTLLDSPGRPTLEMMLKKQGALMQIYDYLRPVVAARREQPRDDLISGLLADSDDKPFSEEEVLATGAMMLSVGHETTTALIGNAVLALLENPDQLALLRNDMSLLPNAIEETLRYNSPAHTATRMAREDFEIEGKEIKKGQLLVLVLGAANRDPEQFQEPDKFDITRTSIKHLGFGSGIHFCVGATLGKMEAQSAVGALVKRFSSLKLGQGTLSWKPDMKLRTLTSLPVVFE